MGGPGSLSWYIHIFQIGDVLWAKAGLLNRIGGLLDLETRMLVIRVSGCGNQRFNVGIHTYSYTNEKRLMRYLTTYGVRRGYHMHMCVEQWPDFTRYEWIEATSDPFGAGHLDGDVLDLSVCSYRVGTRTSPKMWLYTSCWILYFTRHTYILYMCLEYI